MATGDLKNNLRKLQVELKGIKHESVDIPSLSKGISTTFLAIYHQLFVSYSKYVSAELANSGMELYGKTDLKFIESMYKVLRDLYNYKPPITKEQFFSHSFAERKIIMCTQVIQLVRTRHRELNPQKSKVGKVPTSITAGIVALGPRASIGTISSSVFSETSAAVSSPKASAPPVIVTESVAVEKSPQPRVPPVPASQYDPSAYSIGMSPREMPLAPQFACKELLPANITDRFHKYENGGCDISHDPARSFSTPSIPDTMHGHGESPPSMCPQGVLITAVQNPSQDMHKPIDIYAMTPEGQPAAPRSSVRNRDHIPATVVQDLGKKVEQLVEQIGKLEARLQAVEHALPDCSVSPAPVDNMVARLTLVETRMELVNAQLSKLMSKTTSVSEVSATSQRQEFASSILPRPHLAYLQHTSSDPVQSVKPPAINGCASYSEQGENFFEPISPATHPDVSSNSLAALSDILDQQLHTVVNQSPVDGSNISCSTPTTPRLQSRAAVEEHFLTPNTANRHAQASRINDLMKNTENLLNIEVVSPVRAAPAVQ